MCSVSALSSPSLPWPQSTSWILPEARSFSLPGARPGTEMQQGVVWRSCLCEPLPQVQSFIYLDNWFICDHLSHFAGDSTWVGACLMVASLISEHPAVKSATEQGLNKWGQNKMMSRSWKRLPLQQTQWPPMHRSPSELPSSWSWKEHCWWQRLFYVPDTSLSASHLLYLSTPIILITTLRIDSVIIHIVRIRNLRQGERELVKFRSRQMCPHLKPSFILGTPINKHTLWILEDQGLCIITDKNKHGQNYLLNALMSSTVLQI